MFFQLFLIYSLFTVAIMACCSFIIFFPCINILFSIKLTESRSAVSNALCRHEGVQLACFVSVLSMDL